MEQRLLGARGRRRRRWRRRALAEKRGQARHRRALRARARGARRARAKTCARCVLPLPAGPIQHQRRRRPVAASGRARRPPPRWPAPPGNRRGRAPGDAADRATNAVGQAIRHAIGGVRLVQPASAGVGGSGDRRAGSQIAAEAKRTSTPITAAAGTASSRPTKPNSAAEREQGEDHPRPDADGPARRRAWATGSCSRGTGRPRRSQHQHQSRGSSRTAARPSPSARTKPVAKPTKGMKERTPVDDADDEGEIEPRRRCSADAVVDAERRGRPAPGRARSRASVRVD